MSGTRDEVALKLWVVLARAYAAIAEHARAHAATHDLTPLEFGALEALHHKGDMLLGELQDKMLVTSGGITYLVDRLEEKGLVRRLACPSDRRARYASLTPKGTRLVKDIFPDHVRWMRRALAGLSDAEQREATVLLRKLGTYAGATPPG